MHNLELIPVLTCSIKYVFSKYWSLLENRFTDISNVLLGGATPLDEKLGLIVQTVEQTGGYLSDISHSQIGFRETSLHQWSNSTAFHSS